MIPTKNQKIRGKSFIIHSVRIDENVLVDIEQEAFDLDPIGESIKGKIRIPA